jgi:hypothetical protein
LPTHFPTTLRADDLSLCDGDGTPVMHKSEISLA